MVIDKKKCTNKQKTENRFKNDCLFIELCMAMDCVDVVFLLSFEFICLHKQLRFAYRWWCTNVIHFDACNMPKNANERFLLTYCAHLAQTYQRISRRKRNITDVAIFLLLLASEFVWCSFSCWVDTKTQSECTWVFAFVERAPIERKYTFSCNGVRLPLCLCSQQR